MKKFFLFAVFAALPVFSHAGDIYVPDMSLVKAYFPEDAKNLPPQPFAARFEPDTRRFTFVAAIHGADTGTFKLVRDEFKHLVPEAVIVEGINTAEGYNPQKRLNDMAREQLWSKTEAFYAVKLARDSLVPFIGGEPLGKDMKAQILKDFKLEDFAAWYILRTITNSSSPTVAQAAAAFKNEFAEESPIKSEAELKVWFKKRHGKEIPSLKDPLLAKPVSGPEAYVSQKISSETGRFRDMHLCQVVAQEMSKRNRVLIVYGGGHYTTLQYCLENMFGKPEFK